jgi:beta-glucanase (GH16 family)
VHLDGHGALEITALGHGQSWTSGRIQTISSDFGAPAGGEMAVTASIRQPNPSSGLGYWPAFWMLGPGDWPGTGEIDILEDVNALSEHAATLHCGNLDDVNPDGTLGPCHEFIGLSSGLLPCPGCQTGFHTYTAVVDRGKRPTSRSAGIWTAGSSSRSMKTRSTKPPGRRQSTTATRSS